MARWIDDLAVEQVDTDGDGSLETTLYPVTDLLGSVQLLTDDAGTPVERITYDPDGTPHFWSADTNRPTVTRIAWTGDGALPTGDTVTAQAFEIGLSEPIDPASVPNATATLTPDGADPLTLTLTLAADGRAAYLTGATITAGTSYTLHVQGLTDTSHNPLWPEDTTVTVADPNAYEVLNDQTAPQLLAVLDASDGIYLLFDEPVEPAAGYDLTTAVSIMRQGQPVEGAATRLTANLLEWQPAGGVGGLIPGGSYTISGVHLTDLNGNTAIAGTTFTHLTTSDQMLLLAYQAPTDSQPEAESAYGLTTLFQGRTWHADLGMYYYRNRWYLPEAGVFGERDPLGLAEGPNLEEWLGYDPSNLIDPAGLYEKDIHFYAVYYLARNVGFPADEAQQLAWASQQVDDNLLTSPAGLEQYVNYAKGGSSRDKFLDALKAYHFVSPHGGKEVVLRSNPMVSANLKRAEKKNNLIAIGIALHSLADSYSHEGFVGYHSDEINRRTGSIRPNVGHGDAREGGHYPDQPYHDVGKARAALKSVYEALNHIAASRGYSARKTWNALAQRLTHILRIRMGLDGRIRVWQRVIRKDLGEDVSYEKLEVPTSWLDSFTRAAEEQRDFVLANPD